MSRKHKKFLNRPEIKGGKEAFLKYIKDNLVYPELALNSKIQGIVYLKAEIDDSGNVLNVTIEKGLGYGCDEEAIRLIEGIQFGGVKNRGVRLKIQKKFRIEFKLPAQKIINFTLKKIKPAENKTEKTNKYSYTLKF